MLNERTVEFRTERREWRPSTAHRTHLRARGHARKNSKSIVREIGSPEIPVRDTYDFILGTLKKASAAASSGYWLGPPLIRACVLPFFPSLSFAPRASAPLRPAPGASEDGAAPNDPLAIDLRAALSPRALTRARYGGAALGLPSRACSCPCSDGAECARVLCRWCGCEGADAARRAAQPAPNVVPRPAA